MKRFIKKVHHNNLFNMPETPPPDDEESLAATVAITSGAGSEPDLAETVVDRDPAGGQP